MATKNRIEPPFTRIAYLAVQDSKLGHLSSIFRLLPEADLELLRCYMTLALLPSDAGKVVSAGKPFTEAAVRTVSAPQVRVASSGSFPDEVMWNDMMNTPLLVLLAGHKLPAWSDKLVAKRPVALLSQSPTAIGKAKQLGMITGLLAGKDDLREYYKALSALCLAVSATGSWDEAVTVELAALSKLDLFGARSQLAFIPRLPFPPFAEGRSAAYLCARLANNVDEPSLALSVPAGSERFHRLGLRWLLRASQAFALIETGTALPDGFPLSATELGDGLAQLRAESEPDRKYNQLLGMGRKICEGRSISQLVAVAVPRRDVVRGIIPEGATPPEHLSKWSRVWLRALRDLSENTLAMRPGAGEARAAYDRGRETLLYEDRLIACRAASLSVRLYAEPIQVGPVASLVQNDVANLNGAITARSNQKVARLFHRVEKGLAACIPPALLEEIGADSGAVTFLSDLPFEWTLVDGWPMCLTKPVARIPIGLSRLDVFSAALESRVSIDSNNARRVLVLDLIKEDDSIRAHTESFIAASEELGQTYTYLTPRNGAELRAALEAQLFDVVVVDAHGGYDRRSDTLRIDLPDGPVAIDDFVPFMMVPPLWILSACDTSVTGAMRGCFVRKLLSLGAVCVVATLSPVDAFTASMFVGKLLTEVYNPIQREEFRDFHKVFFDTQVSTALLYDPLLPLMKKARRKRALRQPLGRVLGDMLAWMRTVELTASELREATALRLQWSLERHGLHERQEAYFQNNELRPETLFFTAFGAPGRVELS